MNIKDIKINKINLIAPGGSLNPYINEIRQRCLVIFFRAQVPERGW